MLGKPFQGCDSRADDRSAVIGQGGDDNDMVVASRPACARNFVLGAGNAQDSASPQGAIVPCFTPDTLIATLRGQVRTADLKQGDKVVTRDNGLQEIRWIGRKSFDGKELVRNRHLQPVRIKAGALGGGLPEKDMLVSPNHRVLVASDVMRGLTGERETLAAAKLLLNHPGIHQISPMRVDYIHFMCDRHEVVLSDGSWTESFQPGDYSLRGLDAEQREELFAIFPELRDVGRRKAYPTARPSLRAVDAEEIRL